MDFAIMFAKAHQASGEEQLLCLAVIGIVVVVSLIAGLGTTTDVVIKNGVPYCPNCNKQVRFRRGNCRSCGYQFRRFGGQSGRGWFGSTATNASASPPPIPVSPPISLWETLHRDPSDFSARRRLTVSIETTLAKSLLGPKTLEHDIVTESLTLRRSRLQYESRISVWIGTDRHGFEVTVPTHGMRIRISCPRHVSPNVVGAPWDDLLDNLCKIDRWVIKKRNSRSQPLTYSPVHGTHPGLKIEFLQ